MILRNKPKSIRINKHLPRGVIIMNLLISKQFDVFQ